MRVCCHHSLFIALSLAPTHSLTLEHNACARFYHCGALRSVRRRWRTLAAATAACWFVCSLTVVVLVFYAPENSLYGQSADWQEGPTLTGGRAHYVRLHCCYRHLVVYCCRWTLAPRDTRILIEIRAHPSAWNIDMFPSICNVGGPRGRPSYKNYFVNKYLLCNNPCSTQPICSGVMHVDIVMTTVTGHILWFMLTIGHRHININLPHIYGISVCIMLKGLT